MRDTKKELVQLIREVEVPMMNGGQLVSTMGLTAAEAEAIAQHLVDKGVMIPRWIPVTEGFPATVPCNAGTRYSEAVNVLTSGRKVITAIYDGTDFIGDAEFWEAEGEVITHWTPVLLPLPNYEDEERKQDKKEGFPNA